MFKNNKIIKHSHLNPLLKIMIPKLMVMSLLLVSTAIIFFSLCDDYALGQFQETSNGSAPTGMNFYFNPIYNASINYPSNWSVNETDPDSTDRVDLIATFVSPYETYNDNYTEYVEVYRDDGIFYEADLNEYLQEGIDTYQNISNNFTIIDSSTSGTLSNLPAYTLSYSQVIEGQDGQEPIKLKNYETGTLVNNTGYYITFVGEDKQFDKYLPIAKQMIDSFELLLPSSVNLTYPSDELEELDTGTNETIPTNNATNSNLTTINDSNEDKIIKNSTGTSKSETFSKLVQALRDILQRNN